MAAPALDAPSPIGAYLNGVFPSEAPGAVVGDNGWTQIDYYPSLSFVEPIRIVEHPTQNKLVVVGKDGKGWLVTHQQGASDKTLFFDISPIMHGKSGVGEGGISDIVFHPEFGEPGSPNASYVYITYRWAPNKGGVFDDSPTIDGYNRLSRFSVVNGTVSLSTEQVLINQFDREQWHIGGDMFFGSDGFLYISAGDEGNCCSKQTATQRLDGGLWSGVLRIDVDQDPNKSHPIRRQPTHLEKNPTSNGAGWPPSYTQNYSIPNDNPFLDPSGGQLEEFFAIGLRHPWTISFDPATGKIYAADVGQAAMEEVNVVNKGDNHQWGYMEGTVAGVISKPANVIGNEAPPFFAYPRSQGQSVIGAGVYRGEKYPELFGKYLFSDFISGKLWAATSVGGGYQVDEIGAVTAGFPNGINSYLMDRKGDILLAKTSGGLNPNGKIQMLARAGSAPQTPEPPALLSQTGAFTDLASLTPKAGCVPYDLNTPFWSDAALKSRWMCVPNDGAHNSADEKIGFTENGDWTFPKGAVLIKHFELETDLSNPEVTTRLETRFLVHGEDGYYGVTYKWNAAGTDATLLTEGETQAYTIEGPNGPTTQVWQFPSRSECLSCHTRTAGGVLGPKTRQLNKDMLYPVTGRTGNQLETLNALGMFSPALPAGDLSAYLAGVITSAASDDYSKSLEARARSYIDSNCASCHRPGGVRANFDARLTTALVAQGLINGSVNESIGVDDAVVVAPGDLARSLLFHRANTAGEDISMPPLAKNLVDEEGMALMAEWIRSLNGFTLGNTVHAGGDSIDAHHPSLYVNETDAYIHQQAAGSLFIRDMKFFAQRLGNPITPVVMRRDADNDFTVLAIGQTRTSQEYEIGANIFRFRDGQDVEIQVSQGDEIVIAFMDAYPDGSGWGDGSVIPGDWGPGEDQIWALLPNPLILQTQDYNPAVDTASVVEGQKVAATNAGKALTPYENLTRSYNFSIVFGFENSSAPPAPPAGSVEVVNGSFETPTVANWEAFPAGSGAIPGWTIVSGSAELDNAIWPAFVGVQSMDLSGDGPGHVEQTLSGLTPGGGYELKFEYALHSYASTSRSAQILMDGGVIGQVEATPEMKPPAYQTASMSFTAPASGTATLGFKSLGLDTMGVVIDNVRIEKVFTPPSGTIDVVNGSFETPEVATWTAYPAGSGAIPGWTIVSGSAEIDKSLWPAVDGAQTMDLSGDGPGHVEQTLSGLTPEGGYVLNFEYGLHSYASTPRSAQILMNGSEIGQVEATTTMKPPAYQSASIAFTASAAGTATIGFKSLGTDTMGVVIDNVSVESTGVSGPPPTPTPPAPNPQVCTAALATNLAQTGSASQSTGWPTTDANQFPAALAIDGGFSTFTHTGANDTNSSWILDLPQDAAIRTIVLHNRSNCCKSRLRDITVTVFSEAGAPVYKSALLNAENTLGSPNTITVELTQSNGGDAVTGRTVMVQRTADPDLSGSGGIGNADEDNVLSLGEVEVIACAAQ